VNREVGGATTESAAGWANRSEATREPRDYEIVDARFAREFDVELTCPTDDLINTPRDVVQGRFYGQLHDLIQRHTNTLVFTNTRSGAERVLHNLREDYDSYDEGQLRLSPREPLEGPPPGDRGTTEKGSLDVVTTSTSLELGIDMPHIDLVVQVGSPKVRGVPAPAHRPGGSPETGQTVTGRVVALDRDELIECAVMLKKAHEGVRGQSVRPGERPGRRGPARLRDGDQRRPPRGRYQGDPPARLPYRNYDEHDWEQLMRYLTADYAGLGRQERLRQDMARRQRRARRRVLLRPVPRRRACSSASAAGFARVIYMTNIGTIRTRSPVTSPPVPATSGSAGGRGLSRHAGEG